MATATAAGVTEVLNCTIGAAMHVIPAQTKRNAPPSLVPAPVIQPEMGVLLGITGAVRGRLIIEADSGVFSKAAEIMYGMALDGTMLESFVGELGNMIGGNMCTLASGEGLSLDITPPTVLVGQTKLTGFAKALSIPMEFVEIGSVRVMLILEDM